MSAGTGDAVWPGVGGAVSGAGPRLRTADDDPFDWSRRQVRLHHRSVYRVALGVLGPGGEAEAEEVAQEAFLRLHAEGRRFRGDSRVATWLHRVAFRLAVDRRRGPRRRHPHDGEERLRHRADAGGGPFEETRRAERARRLERALRRLPAARQAVIRLHYWLDESVADVARLLDMAPGTVKSHLYRGRAELAELLREAER